MINIDSRPHLPSDTIGVFEMNEHFRFRQTAEEARWRSRGVRYHRGDWDAITNVIPVFDLRPFISVPEVGPSTTPFHPELGELANPFLQVVTRRPRSTADAPIPVGVVGRSYGLVQHQDAAELCRSTLVEKFGIRGKELDYEVGLSELGEWMNLRIYFPRRPPFVGKTDDLTLRLECFNSVEGSCRLVILFGWFRVVCSNGMVIGETKVDVRARHDQHLDFDPIRDRISRSFESVHADLQRLSEWQKRQVAIKSIGEWANTYVTKRWNKTAAARVFHICRSGRDIRIANPFASGVATEKPVVYRHRVDGSPERAATGYDVAQALSYVATRRNNVEERLKWQEDVPGLLKLLLQQHLLESGAGS